MSDAINDNRDRSADRFTRPPVSAVRVQRIGSWDILFSEEEQNIYIVPIDYHPEPFRISMADFKALQTVLAGLIK